MRNFRVKVIGRGFVRCSRVTEARGGAEVAGLRPAATSGGRFRATIMCILGMLAGATMAQTNPLTYRMVPWAEVSDQHMSPLARLVREEDPETWYYAESAHVIAYAHAIRDIDTSITQAEFCYAEIGRLLDLADTGRKAHLILISRADLWDRLVAESGVRPDGMAFQNGREIFVRAIGPVHVSRVPHEMLHFRLHDTYGSLPLWLDEGLALRYGWRAAKAWAASQGLKIARALPAIPGERQLSLDAVVSAKQYPADVAETQAFYRQAEELVAAIIGNIGPARAGAFIKAVSNKGLPWRVSLAEQFAFSDAEFEELAAAVRVRSGEPRDD